MRTGSNRMSSLLAASVLLLAAGPVLGQQAARKEAPGGGDPAPSILSILPPGATIGQQTEWTVSGKNLDGVRGWMVSGSGIEVGEAKPKDASSIVVKVTVSPDAEPGVREVRAVGPEGISNLALIRVDALGQTVEVEPNDSPDQASPIAVGSAAAGVLTPQDVDYYRVEARRGQRVVIDLEARRLGTPVSPVVTVLTARGGSVAQVRGNLAAALDARMVIAFPADGTYFLRVHDNAYAGSNAATYRLRLDTAPFATGLFPLGGERGKTIDVKVSGGDLEAPRSKTITLPDSPGAFVDPGPFDGPGGPVLAPGKLIVGTGPEINEGPTGPDGQSRTELAVGTTANGRIDRPGEVDVYTVKVKKGDKLRVRIRAAALGSLLDSVVAIRGEKGELLAENDDPGNPNPRRGGIALGLAEVPPDSRLDYEAKADGILTLDVTDRYGDGGPEYAYRLELLAAQPDFAIGLLLANPNAARGLPIGNRQNVAGPPGSTGAFNLKPGSRVPVNVLVTPDGFAGTVELRAEGLPPGVTASAAPIRLAGNAQPAGGVLELKAAADAKPGIGFLRIIAVGKPTQGDAITRTATALVSFNPLTTNNPTPFGAGRPITRTLTEVPVAVTGDPISPKREVGFVLPANREATGPLTRAVDRTTIDVRIAMDRRAEPVAGPREFRVVGLAPMRQGLVRIDSVNRPMVMSRPAEK